MLKKKHKPLFFIFFISFSLSGFSYTTNPSKKAGNGTRFGFGPLIGFYTLKNKHAINPSPKMSAMFSLKREICVDRDFKGFFLFGVDYLFHGLNFRSYYFKPDSIKIYDKSFPYNYSLFIQEINVPLEIKYLFKREDNSLFSPYVGLSYSLRYLIQGDLKVTDNGNKVKNDSPVMKFKTPLFYEKINSSVCLTFGWQKNSLSSSKGTYFVELNYKYGFSPYYFETPYSAASLFINSSHLNLMLGLKF